MRKPFRSDSRKAPQNGSDPFGPLRQDAARQARWCELSMQSPRIRLSMRITSGAQKGYGAALENRAITAISLGREWEAVAAFSPARVAGYAREL
jgi:hypothetical protein